MASTDNATGKWPGEILDNFWSIDEDDDQRVSQIRRKECSI